MKNAGMKIWEKRWKALEMRLKHLATSMQVAELKEGQALKTTTDALLSFGAKQFYFFYNGFSNCIEGDDSVVFGSSCAEDAHVSDTAINVEKLSKLFGDWGYPTINRLNDTPMTYMAKTARPIETELGLQPGRFSQLSPAFQMYVNEIFQAEKTIDFDFIDPKGIDRNLQFQIQQLQQGLEAVSASAPLQGFHNVLQDYQAAGYITDLDALPGIESKSEPFGTEEIQKAICEVVSDDSLDAHGLKLAVEAKLSELYPTPVSDITLDNIALECSTVFPPEHVLRVILSQIAIDLGVLEQIFYQRLQLKDNEIVKTLTKADTLAMRALHEAYEKGLLSEKMAAITYFDLGASIRVVPYANIALIAVPYTALNNYQDLLAIPHEVAHQVFWKGVVADPNTGAPKRIIGELGELFADGVTYPDYMKGWVEEIFADVFAENLTHRANRQMLRDIHTHHAPSHSDLDDGTYPPALIRAQILEGLGMQAADLHNEDVKMQEHFGESKFIRAKQREQTGDQTPDAKKTLVRDAAKNLRKMARDIDQKFLNKLSSILKTADSRSTRTTDTHVRLFDALVSQLDAPEIYPKVSVTQFSWTDVVVEMHRELASRGVGGQQAVPIALWMPVFESDGWTKEGPGGVIHPG